MGWPPPAPTLWAHLCDLHVGWVPPHRAVLLPVARVAHQLAVPDSEVSAAWGTLGEHCDGRADTWGRQLSEPCLHCHRGEGCHLAWCRGTHRRLPRLVAYLMWLQM